MKYANDVNSLVAKFIRLLTEKGLRLIDVGISALRHQVGEELFARYVAVELGELQQFRQYFLNR